MLGELFCIWSGTCVLSPVINFSEEWIWLLIRLLNNWLPKIMSHGLLSPAPWSLRIIVGVGKHLLRCPSYCYRAIFYGVSWDFILSDWWPYPHLSYGNEPFCIPGPSNLVVDIQIPSLFHRLSLFFSMWSIFCRLSRLFRIGAIIGYAIVKQKCYHQFLFPFFGHL